MTKKEYSPFPKSQGQEPFYQIQFSVISRTLIVGGSICILQLHPTGM